LYFRSELGLNLRNDHPLGYEVQIYNDGTASRTGTLFRGADRIQVINQPLVQPGEWCTLEVIAEGSRIVVKVNGATTSDLVDSTYRQGHIALQAMGPGATVVRFRKIEIKELNKATTPGSSPDVPKTAETSKEKQKGPGVFMVSALSTPKKERRNFICELQDDGTALREKRAFGRWEKQGVRYIVTPDDADQEKITFTPRGRSLWSAVEIDDEGTRWAWEMQQVTLVATWRHMPPGQSGIVRLWSNGRAGDPDSNHTWTLQGNKLTMRWSSGWVDTVVVSSDGRRYEGRNQVGSPIIGELIEEPE
jgi:hypothetical protein